MSIHMSIHMSITHVHTHVYTHVHTHVHTHVYSRCLYAGKPLRSQERCMVECSDGFEEIYTNADETENLAYYTCLQA